MLSPDKPNAIHKKPRDDDQDSNDNGNSHTESSILVGSIAIKQTGQETTTKDSQISGSSVSDNLNSQPLCELIVNYMDSPPTTESNDYYYELGLHAASMVTIIAIGATGMMSGNQAFENCLKSFSHLADNYLSSLDFI